MSKKTEHIEYIEGLGWTPCEDGLWLSPYIGNYMEGAKMSATFAYYIARMIVDGLKTDIHRAAEKFK